ncbi:hypothetical protein [Hymenobacter terrenus]|nr:hypothetical protein [Hymenobacter terrenus]
MANLITEAIPATVIAEASNTFVMPVRSWPPPHFAHTRGARRPTQNG